MCIRILLQSFWRAKRLSQRLQSTVRYSKFAFSILLWYILKDSSHEKAFHFQMHLLNGMFLHLSYPWTDLGITAVPHYANTLHLDFCTSETNLMFEKSRWCSEKVALHFVKMTQWFPLFTPLKDWDGERNSLIWVSY